MDCLAASVRQRDNPLMTRIRRVKAIVGDEKQFPELSLFDFLVNSQMKIPILFISLKFHSKFREYLAHRISHILAHPSACPPIQLVLVDEEDVGSVETYLEEITMTCVLNGIRLLLAWSNDEAARILEILHVFGPDRAADIARGNISTAYTGSGNRDQWLAQAKDAICTIQGGVGQKDAMQLLNHFGSVRNLLSASKEELSSVPSIGSKKSVHLHNVFNTKWTSDS